MQYALAALILNETGAEINEHNLTAVLEAAGGDVVESRTKALVAALEGVDLDTAIDDGATTDVPELSVQGAGASDPSTETADGA